MRAALFVKCRFPSDTIVVVLQRGSGREQTMEDWYSAELKEAATKDMQSKVQAKYPSLSLLSSMTRRKQPETGVCLQNISGCAFPVRGRVIASGPWTGVSVEQRSLLGCKAGAKVDSTSYLISLQPTGCYYTLLVSFYG